MSHPTAGKPLRGQGASITIKAGLGQARPNYADFIAQYVDPAAAAANLYAEPLQLYDAQGKVIGHAAEVYAYLLSLSPTRRDILLDRIFFGLLRDSGREHTGAKASRNYVLGSTTIDTLGQLNAAYNNYERAYAAIATCLKGSAGDGSFLGGLSTVRTRSGGDITILSPHGEIQVGLASPPSNFPGYSDPDKATYALGFGIVTERGGRIELYADGNISVNQSRVFTLGGGDLTAVSRHGNIDAGKGAKTVQAIQPPIVSYDTYGNITITPFGPASGSGLSVLRTSPEVPAGNADLIAFVGAIDAGDAGIRVSGNINIAALQVLNAGNIQVSGTATGVPTVAAPNIGALTTASNAAGAAAKGAETPTGSTGNSDRSSIIIVEVIGYGGGDDEQEQRRKMDGKQSYDQNSAVQVVGYGGLTGREARSLTEEEKQKLSH